MIPLGRRICIKEGMEYQYVSAHSRSWMGINFHLLCIDIQLSKVRVSRSVFVC